MAPFTDQQIRDKYIADIQAAAIKNRCEGETESWFERILDQTEPVWTSANGCYWPWPESVILSKRELEFFESSDTVWSSAGAVIFDDHLAIQIVLIDWYDPEAEK